VPGPQGAAVRGAVPGAGRGDRPGRHDRAALVGGRGRPVPGGRAGPAPPGHRAPHRGLTAVPARRGAAWVAPLAGTLLVAGLVLTAHAPPAGAAAPQPGRGADACVEDASRATG